MESHILTVARTLALAATILASGCMSIPVDSSPQGARLILDGVDTGKTTPTKLLVRDLPNGTHTVTVRKQGYRTVTPPQTLQIRVSVGAIVGSAILPFPVAICEAIDPHWKKPVPRRLEHFLMEEGEELAPATEPDDQASTLTERLERLKYLQEQGVLTEEEHRSKRQSIIDEL